MAVARPDYSIRRAEPTLGKNQAGDLFFTDGKAEVIFLSE